MNQSSKMHLAVQRDYPNAEQLPLPPNIDANENARFSPLRTRDITSSEISVHQGNFGIDVTFDQIEHWAPEAQSEVKLEDPHLGSYDRHTSVNLGAHMQSTVPEPYGGNNKTTHLNMPGGSWSQQTKYLSHELNSAHYTQLRQELRSDWSHYTDQKGTKLDASSCSLLNPRLFAQQNHFLIINKRFISLSAKSSNEQAPLKTSGESEVPKVPEKETGRSKLKKAIKEYGSTVIVFHVGISLVSLGMFYALVSRWVHKLRIETKGSITKTLTN